MKFAFIIHPLELNDISRKYPIFRYFPKHLKEFILTNKRPEVISSIKGIQSITGATTEGCFIGCPLTPELMIQKMPLEKVYEVIHKCVLIAEKEGASIVGLGAFTSVVGDGGITLAKRSPIAITTGNSYTVATAIEGALRACNLIELSPSDSVLAIVGAAGSIGKTCAEILAPQFQKTWLIGRDQERTQAVASEIKGAQATTDIHALQNADLVITVTSSETSIIQPEHLKSGAIICDVARPRDVSNKVAKERPDVLVIEGGVVLVPGEVDFGFNFGFPPKMAYACMSETMLLALENRAENFTLGKTVSVEQVHEIDHLAIKHGFKLAGFRSFERMLDPQRVEYVKRSRVKELVS